MIILQISPQNKKILPSTKICIREILKKDPIHGYISWDNCVSISCLDNSFRRRRRYSTIRSSL